MLAAESLPERIGTYRVLSRLASRSGKTLYLAREEGPMGFSRDVVLKLVPNPARQDTELSSELAREAAACARLNHPGIVRMHQFFEDGDSLVLVLEYVDGPSLSELLEKLSASGQRLLDSEIAHIGVSILDALSHAHSMTDEKGTRTPVIHRAITPASILLSREGTVKLGGFGMAKMVGRSPDTVVGVVKGATRYVAPEQAAGERITEKVDVYAAALVLWELFTGKAAAGPTSQTFGAADLKELSTRRHASLGTLRADLPRELLAVVDTSLEASPDARAIGASDMARWLRKFVPVGPGAKKLRERVAALCPPLRSTPAPPKAAPRMTVPPTTAPSTTAPPTTVPPTTAPSKAPPRNAGATLLGLAPPGARAPFAKGPTPSTSPAKIESPPTPTDEPVTLAAIAAAPALAPLAPAPPGVVPLAAPSPAYPPPPVLPPLAPSPSLGPPPGRVVVSNGLTPLPLAATMLAPPPHRVSTVQSSAAASPFEAPPSASAPDPVADSPISEPPTRRFSIAQQADEDIFAARLFRPRFRFDRKRLAFGVGAAFVLLGMMFLGAVVRDRSHASAVAPVKPDSSAMSATSVADSPAGRAQATAPTETAFSPPSNAPAPPASALAAAPTTTPSPPSEVAPLALAAAVSPNAPSAADGVRSDKSADKPPRGTGYLTVDSSTYGFVYADMSRYGKIGSRVTVRCGPRFISIGRPDRSGHMIWLAPSQTVKIPCGDALEITMNPKFIRGGPSKSAPSRTVARAKP